jgi:5-oxoprolinase (ATP-hydrolysing) subunit A
MRKYIDINCDLGEHTANSLADKDEAIMPYISSANIACGYHAGDAITMLSTIRLCKKYGVAAGAHPSFSDREGFGRRNMEVSTEDLYAMMVYQIGALKALCNAEGIRLNHVKPHGALYNMSAKDPELCRAIIKAIRAVDDRIIFYGLSNSEHTLVAEELGHPFAAEAYADRGYNCDGHLLPRSESGAIHALQDRSIEQAIQLAKDGQVRCISGEIIHISTDSICLHGDHEDAELLAKALYGSLADEGIMVKSLQSAT